jgi:hypothetical protein
MRRFALLAVVGLLVALTPAVADAGVPSEDPALVRVVHAATYSADDDFPVTLCLDGELVDGDFRVGDVLDTELPAGAYQVDIFTGTEQACVEGAGAISEEIAVEAGDDVTVAAIWPSGGPTLAVWPNDYSCTDPGSARVALRHGADTGGPVDVLATVGGEELAVVEGLAEGAQDIQEAPAGLPLEGVRVVPAGSEGPTLIDVGDVTFDEGVVYEIYAIGGNDGPAGVFVLTVEVDLCETPVESTTSTTATPTTAGAAAAAAAPRCTG